MASSFWEILDRDIGEIEGFSNTDSRTISGFGIRGSRLEMDLVDAESVLLLEFNLILTMSTLEISSK